jgi:hypothetical protein
MEIVSNKANFRVRNTLAPLTVKLTRNKIYHVMAIGFNGHFLLKCDNGRKTWYNNNYFKILDKNLNFKGCRIG